MLEMRERERNGRLCQVEESLELSKTVEELRFKKDQLMLDQGPLAMHGGPRQQLRVCEVSSCFTCLSMSPPICLCSQDCGAQLNLLDHESRLADHYSGRMHLGMVDIRAKVKELEVRPAIWH